MSRPVLPDGARRLFPHHDVADVVAPEHRDFLVARILAEGDSRDLRWLVATVGEAAIGEWVARRSAGKLGRRARALWRLVLGVEPAAPPPIAAEVWPP